MIAGNHGFDLLAHRLTLQECEDAANSRAIDIWCGEDVAQLLPLGLVQPLAQYEDRQGLFATTHVVGGRFTGGYLHSPETELVVAELDTKSEDKA